MSALPPTGQPRSRATLAVFVVLLLGSLVALAYLLSGFFTDAVLGFMLAALSRPAYLRLVERGLRPWLSAAVVTFVVAAAIAVPTSLLLASLSQQAGRAYRLASESLGGTVLSDTLFGEGFFATRAREVFEGVGFTYSAESLRESLRDIGSTIATTLSRQVNDLLSNVLGALYHFVMLLVLLYYGLIDGPTLKQRVFEFSPLPEEEEQVIVDKFKNVGMAILFGNGIGSVLQGLLGGISMWAFGLASPVFWGTVMTLFAFLPLVGISLVVFPVGFYMALTGHWGAAIAFVALNLVQATLIENVVKTKLIGDRMRMHGGLVFFAILGGLGTFGLIGILYGPLVVALFVTLHDLYHRAYKDILVS